MIPPPPPLEQQMFRDNLPTAADLRPLPLEGSALSLSRRSEAYSVAMPLRITVFDKLFSAFACRDVGGQRAKRIRLAHMAPAVGDFGSGEEFLSDRRNGFIANGTALSQAVDDGRNRKPLNKLHRISPSFWSRQANDSRKGSSDKPDPGMAALMSPSVIDRHRPANDFDDVVQHPLRRAVDRHPVQMIQLVEELVHDIVPEIGVAHGVCHRRDQIGNRDDRQVDPLPRFPVFHHAEAFAA
jgi:hypothetical protein